MIFFVQHNLNFSMKQKKRVYHTKWYGNFEANPLNKFAATCIQIRSVCLSQHKSWNNKSITDALVNILKTERWIWKWSKKKIRLTISSVLRNHSVFKSSKKPFWRSLSTKFIFAIRFITLILTSTHSLHWNRAGRFCMLTPLCMCELKFVKICWKKHRKIGKMLILLFVSLVMCSYLHGIHNRFETPRISMISTMRELQMETHGVSFVWIFSNKHT